MKGLNHINRSLQKGKSLVSKLVWNPHYLLPFFTMGLCETVKAQKQTTYVNQVWMAYLNQTRFSKHWGGWVDLHLRTKEDFFTNFSQSITRLGVTYYLNDDVRLTAGYAYVLIFPDDTHPGVTQPEHRPWQQIQWQTKYPRIRLSQYLRLEERFKRKIKSPDELDEGYSFNYRTRYNFTFSAAIGKKPFAPNSFAFVANDELLVNFGKEIVYNYFDQNRFFLGFSYQTNKTDNLQFGYLNVFQQLSGGNKYKSMSGIRVYYFHNLDLRKK